MSGSAEEKVDVQGLEEVKAEIIALKQQLATVQTDVTKLQAELATQKREASLLKLKVTGHMDCILGLN